MQARTESRPATAPTGAPRRGRSITIALLYAVLATGWIVLTDRALPADGTAFPLLPSVAKGLGFVVLTAIALYLLLASERRRLSQRAADLEVLTHLANHSNDILILEDSEQRIAVVNDRAVEAYGMSRERLLGLPVRELRAADARPQFEQDRAAVGANGPVVYETRHRSAQGRSFDVEVSAREVTIAGRRYVHSSIRDLSGYWRERQWLELFFDLPFVGMAITSPESRRWLRCNDELCRMLGYPREELERLTWSGITHPDDLAAEVAEFERVVAGVIDSYRMRKRFLHRDGSLVHAAVDVRCSRRPDGTVEFFIATVQDVTESVRAEAALTRSRDLHAMLAGTSDAVLHSVDARELLEQVCRIAVDTGGFRLAQIHELDEAGTLRLRATTGHPDMAGCLEAAGPAVAEQPARQVLATGDTWLSNDLRAGAGGPDVARGLAVLGAGAAASVPLWRDGRATGALTVYATESGYFDDGVRQTLAQVADALSYALDSIAARQARAEADRVATQADLRLQSILDASVSPIWLADREGRYLLTNQRCAQLLGTTLEKVVGRHRRELLGPEIAAEHEANDRVVFESGEPCTVEEHLLLPEGETTYLSVKFPVRDASGEIYAVGGFASDITEQRRAQRALLEASRRLNAVVEHSPAVIFDLDGNGCVRSVWNRAAEAAFGVPREQAIGRPIPFARQSDDGFAALARRVQHGEVVRGEAIRLCTSDGRVLHVDASAAPLVDADGRIEGTLGILIDATGRVEAQDALARSEAKYRTMFEGHPEPMWIYDPETRRMLAVNDAAVASYGYTREEFMALRIDDLRPAEDLPALLEHLAEPPDQRKNPGIWRHRRKDGSVFDAEVHHQSLQIEGRPARLIVAIDVTERLSAERELQRSQAELRQLNEQLEDRISTRTAELVDAKERAENADRVKSVFLATVSHELRTPLNSIIGFSDLLLQGLTGALEPEQQRQVAIINGAGRHLLALVSDFLDISKIEAGALMLDPQPLEPSTLLEPDLAGYRKSAEDKGLRFEWRPCSKPCQVKADAKRVRQVVANLVSNAIKFTDRGTVTLAIQPADGRVRVTVEDTGIGIASGEHDSIFEPFRQGRPAGSQRDGTGLGLAIARRLVEAMGGEIGLASSPDRGSRFWFTLPAANQEVPTCTSY